MSIYNRTRPTRYERKPKDDGYPYIIDLCKLCDAPIHFRPDGSRFCLGCKTENAPIVKIWQGDLSTYRNRREAERAEQEAQARECAEISEWLIDDIPVFGSAAWFEQIKELPL